MGVIFFNAFPGISNASQSGIKKLFTIIKQQLDRSVSIPKRATLAILIWDFL